MPEEVHSEIPPVNQPEKPQQAQMQNEKASSCQSISDVPIKEEVREEKALVNQ